MPEMTLPSRLRPLITTRKRFKILIGGRGSGKSQSVGDICLMDAQTKGIKTACFREYQMTIDDSVISLLTGEIHRLDLNGFTVQSNAILHGRPRCFQVPRSGTKPGGHQVDAWVLNDSG
jgi:phage terminase large subunit